MNRLTITKADKRHHKFCNSSCVYCYYCAGHTIKTCHADIYPQLIVWSVKYLLFWVSTWLHCPPSHAAEWLICTISSLAVTRQVNKPSNSTTVQLQPWRNFISKIQVAYGYAMVVLDTRLKSSNNHTNAWTWGLYNVLKLLNFIETWMPIYSNIKAQCLNEFPVEIHQDVLKVHFRNCMIACFQTFFVRYDYK